MFGQKPHERFAILLVLAAVLVALAGCSKPEAPFVDSGASYDEASLMKAADSVDTSRLANTPSSEAVALRHEALTALRARGGRAVPVADMLTRTFSAQTRGVPVYFERAIFSGKPAIVMIEAAGPEKGKLIAKRVWVLDEQGEVLFVGSR